MFRNPLFREKIPWEIQLINLFRNSIATDVRQITKYSISCKDKGEAAAYFSMLFFDFC